MPAGIHSPGVASAPAAQSRLAPAPVARPRQTLARRAAVATAAQHRAAPLSAPALMASARAGPGAPACGFVPLREIVP